MDSAPESGFGLGREEIRRRRLLPKALLVGAVAGLISACFRRALSAAEGWRLYETAHRHGTAGLLVTLAIGAIGGGAGVWMVRRFAPETSGSGIPHMKAVVLGDARLRWGRVIPIKFIAGALGIGGGLALGREGPTIQMGGASGLMVADALRIEPGGGERKALIGAGAGAGLAAAFNAPIAGMVFVLEELHGSFSPAVFVVSFLASVVADIVSRLVAGSTAVFALKGVAAPAMSVLPAAAVAGVLAGLLGVAFNRSLLASLDAFDRIHKTPHWLVGGLVGLVSGWAGWMVPGLSGSGSSIVVQALGGRVPFGWLPLLMIVRFGLTVMAYGCGAAGGIFLPLFVIGALGGLSYGSLAHAIVPGWCPHPEVFVILGMGAMFAAIVRAPLTGLVLMIELTGTYDFMLPLMVSCFAAYGIAEALGDTPIYEALRQRGTPRWRKTLEPNPNPLERPPAKGT